MKPVLSLLEKKLTHVKKEGRLRQLAPPEGLVDFSSNDYFGWSTNSPRSRHLRKLEGQQHHHSLGATGSRLLSGNSELAEGIEQEIAQFHQSEAALLFSSGYMANVGLFSSLGQKGDTYIVDEYIHASIIDGCRLNPAKRYRFKHNDVEDLRKKLHNSKGRSLVAIESLYSMDGDIAPVQEILALCQEYEAALIVDEAHALGVYGSGIVQQLGLQDGVFARIITYGKALGCHGSAIVGSQLLRDYLINFCRTFIYSTAMPLHQLLAIQTGYHLLQGAAPNMATLQRKCLLFDQAMDLKKETWASPIKTVIKPGNQEVMQLSLDLKKSGFDVRPIRSPTVPAGSERLRICLHTFNTDDEILALCSKLKLLKK